MQRRVGTAQAAERRHSVIPASPMCKIISVKLCVALEKGIEMLLLRPRASAKAPGLAVDDVVDITVVVEITANQNVNPRIRRKRATNSVEKMLRLLRRKHSINMNSADVQGALGAP